jgi:hypothetical protein
MGAFRLPLGKSDGNGKRRVFPLESDERRRDDTVILAPAANFGEKKLGDLSVVGALVQQSQRRHRRRLQG